MKIMRSLFFFGYQQIIFKYIQYIQSNVRIIIIIYKNKIIIIYDEEDKSLFMYGYCF